VLKITPGGLEYRPDDRKEKLWGQVWLEDAGSVECLTRKGKKKLTRCEMDWRGRQVVSECAEQTFSCPRKIPSQAIKRRGKHLS